MNSSQLDFCNIITEMLKIQNFTGNITKGGNAYIFGQTLRQVAEITDDYKKTWKKIDLCRKHHPFSERAVKILNTLKNVDDIRIWKHLHYEHIIPMKVLRERLLALPIDENLFNSVCEVMKENEVVIMTKEEAKILDGNRDKLYPIDGGETHGKGLRSSGTKEERLSAIEARLHPDYINNTI